MNDALIRDVNGRGFDSRQFHHLYMKFNNRKELLWEVAAKKITTACEVGVQSGAYSKSILTSIPTLEIIYLVDLWQQQSNYIDAANVSDDQQQLCYEKTLANTNKWKHKVKILKGYSTQMCSQIPDGSLDFCYLDARHDYLGCFEDIQAYYPKVKPGGVLAGHDYLTNDDVQRMTPGQDWSICHDGSINTGAVKGAVLDFAEANNYTVYHSTDKWPSWAIIKNI